MKGNETSDGKRSGRMLTGTFTNQESAESAFSSLHERSYSENDINPIISDEARKKHFSGDTEKTEIGAKAAEGAGKGSAVSGTVAALAGVKSVIGTSLANIIS